MRRLNQALALIQSVEKRVGQTQARLRDRGGVINGELAFGWNSLSIIAVVNDHQKGPHLLAGNFRSVTVTITRL